MKTKSEKTEDYLVFISHSSKDHWVARQIANLIEQKGKKYGITTFLDEKDISGGDLIPEIIRKNIQTCNEFLVLLSYYSIKSNWVVAELGAAWGLEKRITAIIDKITPDEMQDIISLYKAIDLNDFDQYIVELINRVKEAKK
ncbi:MAG: hypothetical protein QG641_231 [Candidatus Poribacteria bacterium]|nr:hypothetical protein [Candidatus Poribacteria bacterium]